MRVYFRAVSTWSDEKAFTHQVADGVADAVADGVAAALDRVGRELADIEVGDKRLTVDDLAHLRDLYLSGQRDRLRQELQSRFTRAELEELHQRLDALAREPRHP